MPAAEARRAAHVVFVLVGQHHGVDAVGIDAHLPHPPFQLAAGKAGVHQQLAAGRLDDHGVAAATGAQDANPKRRAVEGQAELHAKRLSRGAAPSRYARRRNARPTDDARVSWNGAGLTGCRAARSGSGPGYDGGGERLPRNPYAGSAQRSDAVLLLRGPAGLGLRPAAAVRRAAGRHVRRVPASGRGSVARRAVGEGRREG